MGFRHAGGCASPPAVRRACRVVLVTGRCRTVTSTRFPTTGREGVARKCEILRADLRHHLTAVSPGIAIDHEGLFVVEDSRLFCLPPRAGNANSSKGIGALPSRARPVGVATHVLFFQRFFAEVARCSEAAVTSGASSTSLPSRSSIHFSRPSCAPSARARLYTLVATCEARGIDPFAYLADVIPRVQDHPKRRLDELLPGPWRPSKPGCQPARTNWNRDVTGSSAQAHVAWIPRVQDHPKRRLDELLPGPRARAQAAA